ncbi:MAG: type I polyketide synthase, partial [Chloroflexales bacterium]|nr:type I polyketide synthase [Chloroflexales bacterium]
MANTVDYQDRLRQALLAIQKLRARLEAAEQERSEPIAVVGMACRLPGGASSPEAYWQLLRNGVDAIGDIPAGRWDTERYYSPDPKTPGTIYVRQGGFLENIDQFEPQLFGISPREAVSMDPQQRILLEVVWEALEQGGIAPDGLAGSSTGVFVGVSTLDYMLLNLKSLPLTSIDAYFATGNILNAIAGRVAYSLGLQGPSLAIDTACSSSLTAVHIACQNLRAGETRMAIAAGVNVTLVPEVFVAFCRWGMLAPDARCKTFDARADGFVRGEGCGVVVLKRLSDAVADGDHIHALILGSAANQDGASSGLSVPNGLAQQAVIQQALKNAGVAPQDIDYVEAHGTGTSLGDPIEIEAMAKALCDGRSPGRPLLTGSVKTNIGHLESASGVAGLLKVILALQHGELPPHLHLQERSPRISWERWPIDVPTSLTPWPSGERPRIAGVSSFGFSGNNVHVIVREPPQAVAERDPARTWHVLALSARTEEALRAMAGRYAAYIDRNPDVALADLCDTANTGRARLAERLAIPAATVGELGERLSAFASGRWSRPAPARPASQRSLEVAFLFTGQGAQYPGMGRQLYAREPIFRQALDRCAQLLRP